MKKISHPLLKGMTALTIGAAVALTLGCQSKKPSDAEAAAADTTLNAAAQDSAQAQTAQADKAAAPGVPQKPQFAGYFKMGDDGEPFALNLYEKSKQTTLIEGTEVECHGLICNSFNGGMRVDEDVVTEATLHEDGNADIKYVCGRTGCLMKARLVYNEKAKTFTAEDAEPVDPNNEYCEVCDCYLNGTILKFVKPLK